MKKLFGRLAMFYAATFALIVAAATVQVPSPRADYHYPIDSQLSVVMKATAQTSKDTKIKETWAWLEQLSSKPACHQIAISQLTVECQLLDKPSEFAKAYPHQVLEDVQSEFALKLGLCEYVFDDRSEAPPKCRAFLPSQKACVMRSWWGRATEVTDELCYPKTEKADLQRCLKSMRDEGQGQGWTSYSNARIRAMQICQLARGNIDREEDIKIHKNLTQVVANLHESVELFPAKLQSMSDQLGVLDEQIPRMLEEWRRRTDESVEVAHKANRELEETNQGLRNVQSGLTASQRQIDTHYDNLRTKLALDLHRDVALSVAVVEDAMKAMILDFSNHVEMQKGDVQAHHTKNMLALQQQHDTSIQSINTLTTGILGVTSNVDDIKESIRDLRNDLDSSIAQVETVNAGLGIFASFAQVVGRILGKFETFIICCAVSVFVLSVYQLAIIVLSIPILGNVARKPIVIMLLAMFASTACIFVLLSLPSTQLGLERLHKVLLIVRPSEQTTSHLKVAACTAGLACSSLYLFMYAFNAKMRLLTAFGRLARGQAGQPQHQRQHLSREPSLMDPAPTEEHSIRFDTEQATPSIKPFFTSTLKLSKEAEEDKYLRDRIRSFERARTV